ncbi:MAG: hypothetical protein R6X25_02610 [Candidatus Krumholzibacteriia bacterium]
MKILAIAIIIGLLAVIAPPASAQCPDSGWYQTSDGTLQAGRLSEAWCGTPENAGQPGNTVNSMSWDGGTLGAMWHVWGMQVDENGAQLVADTVDGLGNGYRDYRTGYAGGQFWLSRDYPWGAYSSVDLTGFVSFMDVNARVIIQSGVVVGIDSNVFLTGYFDGCADGDGSPRCLIEFVLANASLDWRPGWPDMPADYPALLCGTQGELFTACCITALVTCDGVSAEGTTWSELKALFR